MVNTTDQIALTFSEKVTLAADASFTFRDADGSVGTISRGGNATMGLNSAGTIAFITLTGVPVPEALGSPVGLDIDGANETVISSTGVADVAGNLLADSPLVGSLGTTAGPAAGGQSVVITGSGLTGATAVTFGATDATSFVVDSATQITAVSPVHAAGAVAVNVTTPYGTGTLAPAYTFVADPAFSSMAADATAETVTLTFSEPILCSTVGAGDVTFSATGASDFTSVALVCGDGVVTSSTTIVATVTDVAATDTITGTLASAGAVTGVYGQSVATPLTQDATS